MIAIVTPTSVNYRQQVFLSADLDAIGDALAAGFARGSTLAFDKTGKGTANAWKSVSDSIASMRSGFSEEILFTEEDRKKQENERKLDGKKINS